MDFNLGSFQDTSFARQVQYSKPTVGGMLWISGSQAFVPFSSMCKKQTAVSHRFEYQHCHVGFVSSNIFAF